MFNTVSFSSPDGSTSSLHHEPFLSFYFLMSSRSRIHLKVFVVLGAISSALLFAYLFPQIIFPQKVAPPLQSSRPVAYGVLA